MSRTQPKCGLLLAGRRSTLVRSWIRLIFVLCVLFLPSVQLLSQEHPLAAEQRNKPAGEKAPDVQLKDGILSQLIAQIAISARALEIVQSPSERTSKPPAIAPGAPPLLSFRYFDGQQRHRFGNLDLVMDDAGH